MRGGRIAGSIVAFASCVLAASLLSSCAGLRPGVTRQTIAAEYYSIAEAYADLGKYEKAIPYYQEAAKHPEFANAARYGLARMYALSGKWEEAADIFGSLLAKDPENEMLESAYSFSIVSSGKSDEALIRYKTVMDRHPDDPVLARNYAEVQIIAGQYDGALETVKSARSRFAESDIMKDFDSIEAKATAAIADAAQKTKEGKPSSDGNADKKAANRDGGKTEGQ
jgi:predicted Zn-dependent protease